MTGATTDLRVDPGAFPKLIAAYEKAAADVADIVADVQRRGRLPQSWTQDPTSIAMTEHYNEQIFGTDSIPSPYCTFGALRIYQQELVNVRDMLIRMQADYERTEAEAAAPFSTL